MSVLPQRVSVAATRKRKEGKCALPATPEKRVRKRERERKCGSGSRRFGSDGVS